MIKSEKDGIVYWTYNNKLELPTIIMIHGFRGTHSGVGLIAENLSEFRTIAPDLPGFGESNPMEDEHSVDNYVIWLNKFIKSIKLSKPPILLGHSFGSIVSSNYAKKYPETISKLILINPIGAPALEGPRAILTRLTTFYFWLGEKLPETLAIKLLSAKPLVMIASNIMTKTKDEEIRKFVREQHSTCFSSFTNRRVVCESYKASIQNTVADVAADIKQQTLLIAGDLDDITPLAKQRELANIFPNAKLDIIKGVGHLAQYETPDKIAKLIKNFLKD